jgi:hypothetical protein
VSVKLKNEIDRDFQATTEGFTPSACAKIVPESNIFMSLRLALSEEQIPRFVGNASS